MKSSLAKIARALAAAAALLAAVPDLALAQAGAKGANEALSPTPFLAGAYAAIWLCLLVFVVSVVRRLTRVQGEIENLRKRLDQLRAGWW